MLKSGSPPVSVVPKLNVYLQKTSRGTFRASFDNDMTDYREASTIMASLYALPRYGAVVYVLMQA